MYERHRASLDDFRAAFDPIDNQVGAVFSINGHPAGFELFDSPSTLSSRLEAAALAHLQSAGRTDLCADQNWDLQEEFNRNGWRFWRLLKYWSIIPLGELRV